MIKGLPRFPKIILDCDHWGEGALDNLIAVFESVIGIFLANMDNNIELTRPLFIYNSESHEPPIYHPKFYSLDPHDKIFINCKGLDWAEYSFQLSHEFCHYCMNFQPNLGYSKFGWFEETLTELSSIYVLKKMSEEWRLTPPYDNWRDYSNALNSYANSLLTDAACVLTKPFHEWFRENIEKLFQTPVDRVLNRTIAIQLYTSFYNSPELWRVIQYFKDVDNPDALTWEAFFCNLKQKLPTELHERFKIIETIFHIITLMKLFIIQ